ncbi:MAG: DeoR/GlpR transcriptional regulator [bacterium]|nr:DeoR/GlpR transcriptional regulator [bacterium]
MDGDANDTMFAEERKLKIIDLLNQNKKVTVAELVRLFNVSSATIRSDLRELSDKGQIIRTHGGAIIESGAGFEPNTEQKRDLNLAAKQQIARLAIDLIKNGDTVIFDTGTTTLELAKLLNQRHRVTAVTNDFEIARVLEEMNSISVVMLGGELRKNFHCTVGAAGINMLAQLSVDKAFMGTNSLSISKGLSTPNIQQAEIKKAMIAGAQKVILLCSNRKLGKDSFAHFASLDQIDTLIIEKIDVNEKFEFEERGVEVLTASV